MPKKQYHHGDLKNALIKAGIEVLAREGTQGLSLRKVARRAGVSHAAPYAHFANKQTLIAAISTEGYKKLYMAMNAALLPYEHDPLRQLVEVSWAYVEWAMQDPDHFRITTSGVIEKERDFPAFVEASKKSYSLVEQIVMKCQQAGILASGTLDLTAVSVWSLVHGLVSLLVEGQISHTILERWTARQMLLSALNQITCIDINQVYPQE